jgi:hypothetical protein
MGTKVKLPICLADYDCKNKWRDLCTTPNKLCICQTKETIEVTVNASEDDKAARVSMANSLIKPMGCV